jgi:hypothetical protein
MRRPIAALALAALALLAPLQPATATTGTSSVAVVACPTTYGVSQSKPSLPTSVSVAAGSTATAGLRAYSNGFSTLLAPKGWHCHAVVGADGSASVTVAAGGTGHVKQPAVTSDFAATYGVAASLACPLFAAAKHQLPTGVGCITHRPRGERTRKSDPHTVEFTDPPHLRGDGNPSGGSDPAHGVMAFVPASNTGDGYAFVATCTLPAARHARCTTILADALTRIPGSS